MKSNSQLSILFVIFIFALFIFLYFAYAYREGLSPSPSPSPNVTVNESDLSPIQKLDIIETSLETVAPKKELYVTQQILQYYLDMLKKNELLSIKPIQGDGDKFDINISCDLGQQIISINYPTAAQGPQGPQGPTGPRGTKGPIGTHGPTGHPGPNTSYQPYS